jgi:hypothetical protein
MKQKARLENWYVMTFFGGQRCLIGEVYEHPRLSDGKEVATSAITDLDEVNNTAETQNTVYTLGKKADVR